MKNPADDADVASREAAEIATFKRRPSPHTSRYMATGQKPTSEKTNSGRIGITPGALGGCDDPKHSTASGGVHQGQTAWFRKRWSFPWFGQGTSFLVCFGSGRSNSMPRAAYRSRGV